MSEELDTVTLDATMAPKVFKPGEYVILRCEMTAEDDIATKNRLAKMSSLKQGEKKPELTMTLGDSQLATMQRMIVGWSLMRKTIDPQGNIRELPFPYSVDNVRKLRKPVWDYVYAKINELNPDPDEEEQESFLPRVVDSTEEGPETERVYRLK